MILGLEPYIVALLLACLVFALIQAVALAILVGVFLAGAPVTAKSKQLTSSARAASPLSPNPIHAHPALPPLVR